MMDLSDARGIAPPNGLVSLCPAVDLHHGFHGAIIDAGLFRYSLSLRHAMHHFLFDGEAASPHQAFHYGEFLELPGHRGEVVHSTRWPVLGANGWLVDTDDIAFPIICGRAAINPIVRELYSSPLSSDSLRLIRQRALTMLSAYLHPSCVALLLWADEHTVLKSTRAWMERLGLDDLFTQLCRKLVVVRPAAYVDPQVADKWMDFQLPRVVFCGRDFETKNGQIALAVFERVLRRFPNVQFTYIGRIPEDVQRRYSDLLGRITHLADATREEVRRQMQAAHVLFHPSRYESVGLVYMEAAGCGAAVVTARGGGMDYVDGFFEDGGALLIDRDCIPESLEEREFEVALVLLLSGHSLARRLGMQNYSRLACGDHSMRSLLGSLESIYDRAATNVSEPLAIDSVSDGREWQWLSLSSLELRREETELCSVHGRRFII